jgi:hypothetical protein
LFERFQRALDHGVRVSLSVTSLFRARGDRENGLKASIR